MLGFHTGIGFWLLLGASPADLPEHWQERRATPLGMRALIADHMREKVAGTSKSP